jgi:hypothetical protein
MAISVDATRMNAVLKEVYTPEAVARMADKDHPFIGLIKKKRDVGESFVVPIITTVGSGGANFANAQAYSAPQRAQKFTVTPRNEYSTAKIAGRLLRSTDMKQEAFVDAITFAMDGSFKGAADQVSRASWRDGNGWSGQISSISSGVITLANPIDVIHFHQDHALQACATVDGTMRSGSGAIGYVIRVNERAGTVTVSTSVGGSAATPTGWVNSDYLFPIADSDHLKIQGVSAWVPLTAPTSGDSFNGVDRSVSSKLYGQYFDHSAMPMDQAVLYALSLMKRYGTSAKHMFGNADVAAQLNMALSGRVRPTVAKGKMGWGYNGFEFDSGIGTVQFITDNDVPAGYAAIIQLDTWSLLHHGPSDDKYIDILDYGQQQMVVSTSSDEVEIRVGGYMNLGCSAPGWNGLIKVPTAD